MEPSCYAVGRGLLDMTDSLGLCVALLGRACGRNKHCHGCASARVITVVGLACMVLCVHVSLLPRVGSVSGTGAECVILFTWVRPPVYVGLGLGAVLFRQLWCTFVFCVVKSVCGGPLLGHPCLQCLGVVLAGWGR